MEDTNWSFSNLSLPVNHFQELFKYFKKQKYKTFLLSDNPFNYNHEGNKNIVLTFDDGYLDNRVYLFPLLEKYDIKANIFINPEFIDPGRELRPNMRYME